MSDLVKELRDAIEQDRTAHNIEEVYVDWPSLAARAADEIERLRSLIKYGKREVSYGMGSNMPSERLVPASPEDAEGG